MDIFPQVLISGASGLVGSALRTRLEEQAVPCAILVRELQPGSSAYFWDPDRFEFREEMRRLNGIRAVVHLAGESVAEGRWTAEKKQKIRDSRIRSTNSLVELLSRLDQRPEVLICASAVGYYGNRGEEVLTESSGPGDGFLVDVCREWEAAAATAIALGVRVVSLRFGVILSAGGGALAKMLPVFRLGVGGILGSGRQWMSWVSLPDVLRIIEFCIEHAAMEGPVNVVSVRPGINAEFTRTLAHHLHRPALIPVPALALRMAFGEMADAALLASARVIPAKLQASGFVFDHPTLEQAFQSILPN